MGVWVLGILRGHGNRESDDAAAPGKLPFGGRLRGGAAARPLLGFGPWVEWEWIWGARLGWAF